MTFSLRIVSQTYAQPWFLLACMSFWLQFFLQKAGIHIPWIHAWWDDLICLPVVMHLITGIFRAFHPQGKTFVLDRTMIVMTFIWISIVFEFLLPMYSEQYVSDPIDILCYATGGWIYFRYLNNPLSV
ncbi:MAG: hypothetical protein JJU28_24230 [Cyclobacteriaceae bacterium]|nr:hypothetical protein [Cyclobacteriaceae bacterium]